jgi:hypothetical protein
MKSTTSIYSLVVIRIMIMISLLLLLFIVFISNNQKLYSTNLSQFIDMLNYLPFLPLILAFVILVLIIVYVIRRNKQGDILLDTIKETDVFSTIKRLKDIKSDLNYNNQRIYNYLFQYVYKLIEKNKCNDAINILIPLLNKLDDILENKLIDNYNMLMLGLILNLLNVKIMSGKADENYKVKINESLDKIMGVMKFMNIKGR